MWRREQLHGWRVVLAGCLPKGWNERMAAALVRNVEVFTDPAVTGRMPAMLLEAQYLTRQSTAVTLIEQRMRMQVPARLRSWPVLTVAASTWQSALLKRPGDPPGQLPRHVVKDRSVELAALDLSPAGILTGPRSIEDTSDAVNIGRWLIRCLDV